MKKLGFVFLFIMWGLTARAIFTDEINVDEMLKENRVALITDFDGTLTGPAWKTLWILQKVPSLNTYLQVATQTPEGRVHFKDLAQEIAITESEFWNMFLNSLAVKEPNGSYTVRERKSYWLPVIPGMAERTEPVLFIPGYYTINEQSFRYFRSSPGNNYLESDNRIADSLERPGYSRFGIAFALFQKLTNQPESLSNIHISTARGQEPAEFTEGLFRSWQQEGWIKYIYGAEYVSRNGVERETINIYPLGRGESILYGHHLSEKKARLFNEDLVNHYRLLASQEGKRYLLVLPEDNMQTLHEYHKILLHLSGISNYADYLDFLLVHAGTAQEVKESHLPDRFTLYKGGYAHKAPDQMVRKLFLPKDPQKADALRTPPTALMSCKQLFVRSL